MTELTKGKMPELIRKLSIPAAVGLLFNTLYNVVDTFYAGQLSSTALASLSLSFPIFFVIIALAQGLSTGAAVLISNELGKGNSEKAVDYLSQAISFALGVAIAATLVGLVVAPWLLRLLGAEAGYLETALSYLNIIILGSIFMIITYTANSYLHASGDTATLRDFLVVGFLLNIVLDPLFMYGFFGIPGMGVKGIAIATVLIQFFGLVYISYRVIKKNKMCLTCFKKFVPDLGAYRDIAKQGVPASLNMMSIAIGSFIITYFVSQFGQAAVAAYGIGLRIEQIVLLPALGLNIAVLSIVGQNYGAENFTRVKEAINKASAYGIIIMVAGGIIVFSAADIVSSWFTTDADIAGMAAGYLHVDSFVFAAYAILFISIASLQGIKKPNYAFVIGAVRQIILPLLIFPLFSSWLGLSGVWYGILTINWLAAIATLWYLKYAVDKKLGNPVNLA